MGMGMGIGFANPMDMGMGMGMGMIFENEYGYGYSSTRPVPAPRPSLLTGNNPTSHSFFHFVHSVCNEGPLRPSLLFRGSGGMHIVKTLSFTT